ncbi:ATPase [Shewanella phage S0112]|nr:ATPase [Shewanella phage S0112]
MGKVNIQLADEVSSETGVKALVYGRAGIGKTVLTATCPRPILLSAESGVLSLRKKNLVKLFGKGDDSITYEVPTIVIEKVEDLVDVEKWLISSKEANYFDTICIDSISEIAEKVLLNAKPQAKDPRQAYGAMLDQMLITLRVFRDTKGKHVYCSAKEEYSKDDVTGIKAYRPMMPGTKLGPAIPYLFDEVMNLNVGQTEDGQDYRYLLTQPTIQYDAKCRSGCLDKIEQPHLGFLFNKILKG